MVREITTDEVKKHHDRRSAWIIIHNDVYDVTSFLGEHPGGEESLLEFAGKDGTKGFEDVGHSQDAREMLVKYKIGSLAPCDIIKKVHSCTSCCLTPKRSMDSQKSWRTFDGPPRRLQSPKASVRSIPCGPTESERRIQKIVVPRNRIRIHPCERRQPPPPPSSSKLKWAVIALAGAIVIGFALKKYLS
ncbi:PREDICTED: cytochrome b5-like isoform X1 [Papilio polytes]|uniref:cytochrome b5-like isoform X1 n=1 Tax=Papilio polytes TaxID=76194 RepID=UPI000675E37E|nr:PREDICTED: cytochrome b5-like isoform X1 [Papilio polytes]